MNQKSKWLTAEDYSYALPDHWILEKQEVTSHFPLMHAAYVRRVVEIVRNSGSKKIIEVGCGDGWNCGQLVKAGLEVVGVDWSQNAISYANMLVPMARFYCGDLRDPEFLQKFPGPFDAAVFVEVLEHIPPKDCVEALRNISALLKVGGLLVLTTPSINSPNTNPQHYRHFDERTLRELIGEVGDLKIIAVEGYGDVPYQTSMYRKMRWFQNRYYTVKPVVRKLLDGYKQYCLDRPLDRSAGFILQIEKH